MKYIVAACIAVIAAAFLAYGSFNIDEQIKTEAYFCPADDCFSLIASLIANSSKADCAFYTLNSVKIENAIKAVNARVVANEKCIEGIECKSKPSYLRGLMHNKFCILDDSVVVTGSFNPNEKSKSYLNNVVVLHSSELAEEYADEFNELWKGGFGAGKKAGSKTVFFCPEDNCQKHLLEEIEKAEKSIYFMTYSFTDNEIADKLLEKQEEDIIVRGFFDKAQNSKWSVYNNLEKAGLDVRVYETAVLHHKVFIIDNSTIITGSYNPTQNGNENNDENMLIIRDKAAASSFVNAFNAFYAEA